MSLTLVPVALPLQTTVYYIMAKEDYLQGKDRGCSHKYRDHLYI